MSAENILIVAVALSIGLLGFISIIFKMVQDVTQVEKIYECVTCGKRHMAEKQVIACCKGKFVCHSTH